MNIIGRKIKTMTEQFHSWDDSFYEIRNFGIELTTKCNSKCIHCNHEICKDKPDNRLNRNMNWKTFDDTLTFISKFRVKEIYPSGLGEPLMNSDFFDMMKIIRERFPYASITLFENAVLLNEDNIDKIINYNILDKIVLSLSYNSRDVYRKKIQTNNYDRVKNNIKSFLKRKNRPIAEVHVFHIWDNLIRYPATYLEFGPYMREGDKLTHIHYYKLTEGPKHRKRKLYPCDQLYWGSLTIDIDGKVFACCAGNWYVSGREHVQLGTIYDAPEVIYKRLENIRNKHEHFDFGECRNCDYIHRERIGCKEKYKRRLRKAKLD